MQDDWFKVDLPEYLLPPDLKPHPEEENENNDSKKDGSSPDNDEIDDNLVNILSSTMGYEKDEIYESLESSEDTPAFNEIRDAYMLIKENKSLIKDMKANKSVSDELDTFCPSHLQLFNNKANPIKRVK